MSARVDRWLDGPLGVAALGAVLTSAFDDLRLHFGSIDPPVCDVFGATLLVLYSIRVYRDRGVGWTDRARSFPGLLPWTALVLVAALSATTSPWPSESAWFVVRKMIFPSAAYGVALVATIRRLGHADRWLAFVGVEAVLLACLGAAVSIPLWMHGYPSTPERLRGLLENHKALAVDLAPLVALLWLSRPALAITLRRFVTFAVLLSLVAIGLIVSRSAFVTLIVVAPLLYAGPRSSPSKLPLRLATLAVLAVVTMSVAPFVLHNPYMQDSFASRQSLDRRAWDMFSGAPLFGRGPGTSVLWPLPAADARVAGIDAHGVIQKLLSEQGLAGLFCWGAYAATIWKHVRPACSAADPIPRAAAVGIVALHTNLLLSTDTFHAPHWVPFGVMLALAMGRTMGDDLAP